MSKLLDIINSSLMLKRLHNIVEFGMNTSELNMLLQYLHIIEVEGTEMTSDHISQLKKQITDEMSTKNCSNRDIVEISNIIAIYGKTAIDVQKEPVPSEDIDISWAAKFYDCAKTVNDQELQLLWSKILADELLKPGSYFKRTLDVFLKADKFEIDWFFDITKFIYDKACIPDFILTDNKYYPFNQFQTLVDAGFVNSSNGSLHYNKASTLRFPGSDMKIEIINSVFGISMFTLTDAGSQLFDLRPEKSTDDYLNGMKEMIERNGLAKVTSIEPNPDNYGKTRN